MKICFLSSNPIGGFRSSLFAQISSLLDDGYEVTLYILQRTKNIISLSGLDQRVKIIFFSDFDINTKFLRKRSLFRPCYLNFYLMKKFYHHIKREKFRIKYARYNAQIYSKFVVESFDGILDLTDYDVVISWEEVFCNYFLAKRIKAKYKIGFIHPDYVETNFSKYIDKPYLKRLNSICLVSKANYESFVKTFPLFRKKSHFVHNLLDLKNISALLSNETTCPYQNNVFNMVTVCRLDRGHKALDRALKICEKLHSSNISYCWHFIGDGEYMEEMKRYIFDNNLNDYVILHGHKENPFPYIKYADLFVLQSYYEGYPMSVLEAIYTGTPVFVTNFKSAYEITNNEKYGFVVENDFDHIYNKLSDIINNPILLTEKKNNLTDNKKNKMFTDNELLNVIYLAKKERPKR